MLAQDAHDVIEHEPEPADERPYVCRGGTQEESARKARKAQKNNNAKRMKRERKRARQRRKAQRRRASMNEEGARSRQGRQRARGDAKGNSAFGSLTVKRIEGDSRTAPKKKAQNRGLAKEGSARKSGPWRVSVSIRADRARLGDLALKLSDATGIGVVVHPNLVSKRLTVAMPRGTAVSFMRMLRSTFDFAVSRRGTTMFIDHHGAIEHRQRARHRRHRKKVQPKRRGKLGGKLQTLVVPVAETISARQIAYSYCRTVASRRGSASVLGNLVVIRDRRAHVQSFKEVLSAVGQALETGAVHATGQSMRPAAKADPKPKAEKRRGADGKGAVRKD